MMPLSDKYTARVLVANGFVYSPYSTYVMHDFSKKLPDSIAKKTLIDEVFKYATFINNHPFWKAQIEQLHVNKDMDIELIPRVGNHTIVFGNADNIESKFEKLIVFYNKGLSNTGWNEYSVINLKFKDQVVCTKR
jgi:cell division protein FtsQ